MEDTKEELSLQNVCNGNLAKQFAEMIPVLMSATKKGQKSSIAINIVIARPEDMDTMAVVDFSITPKFPAKKGKALATITGDCKLKTEKVVELQQGQNLFAVNGGVQKAEAK